MQHLPASDKIDMDYLKSDQIGKVIASGNSSLFNPKGLAELYKKQPKFPVSYLAQWLLNYSKTQKNHQELDAVIKHKEDLQYQPSFTFLRVKSEQQALVLAQQEEQAVQENQRKQQEENHFREEVERNQYHEKFLCSEFCEYLVRKQGGLTGVYVGYVDFPPKPLLETDDEETAHQFTDQPKIIRYIGANKTHSFMIGQTLSLESGVTGRVFDAPPAQDAPADGEPVPPPPSMVVYVPSVVQEPKIVYFQWPKLGAYFAVPLVYQSCLLPKALDSGLDNRLAFRRQFAEQAKEREGKETEYQERIRAAQEAGEDADPIIEEFNAVKAEWVDLKEKEFETEQRQFVLCFDTLGQDREISAEARQYFEEYTYYFAQKWEEREKQLLSQDIDKMIAYYEQVTPKDRSDQLTIMEDQAVDQLQSKFDDLKEREKEYQFEIQSIRLTQLTQQLNDPSLYNEFISLRELRVFKFPGILATLLIFLGYSKEEINIPGTNILDWTKCKVFINEGLFERIGAYTHRGPRTDQVPAYAKLGRLSKRLDKFDLEAVESFNVCYGKMLKWLQLTISLRRADVEIRRIKIAEKKQLRETRQAEVEKIKESKQNALSEFKNALSPEDQETFNQEEWEANYDNDHPLPEIPDDVENDIDEDYDEV